MAVNYGSRISKIFYERFAANGKSQGKIRLSLIPLLTNELTSLVKDSTLISVTGFLHDVMWRATRVGREEFKHLEALIIAAIIYLILFTLISLSGKALRITMTASESDTKVSA
jgi:ABC-type amino acid transport system permease subunit